jgi:four helix bundle protein
MASIMSSSRYQDLVVWQKAMLLVKSVYQLTKRFPDDERFGLTSQLRRAAVSIPSNIAEGQGRLTKGEFKQFLGTARGSVFEVETQLLLAVDLNYIDQASAQSTLELSGEVSRMLNGLIKSLGDQPAPGRTGNSKPETGNS